MKKLLKKRPPQDDAKKAFTLIEMLVVMTILVVLVSLIVSVSKYVRNRADSEETKGTQAILMNAINAFYEKKNDYPAETGTNFNARNNHLFIDLSAEVPGSLGDLPKDALQGQFFYDGFGKVMDYRRFGGLGGGPVIISAGPDKDMKDDPNDKANDDNIRSDQQ